MQERIGSPLSDWHEFLQRNIFCEAIHIMCMLSVGYYACELLSGCSPNTSLNTCAISHSMACAILMKRFVSSYFSACNCGFFHDCVLSDLEQVARAIVI
jgi:hypothetical protein